MRSEARLSMKPEHRAAATAIGERLGVSWLTVVFMVLWNELDDIERAATPEELAAIRSLAGTGFTEEDRPTPADHRAALVVTSSTELRARAAHAAHVASGGCPTIDGARPSDGGGGTFCNGTAGHHPPCWALALHPDGSTTRVEFPT